MLTESPLVNVWFGIVPVNAIAVGLPVVPFSTTFTAALFAPPKAIVKVFTVVAEGVTALSTTLSVGLVFLVTRLSTPDGAVIVLLFVVRNNAAATSKLSAAVTAIDSVEQSAPAVSG